MTVAAEGERGERRSQRGGVGEEACNERCTPIRWSCDHSSGRFFLIRTVVCDRDSARLRRRERRVQI
jgi:hypothetical protein